MPTVSEQIAAVLGAPVPFFFALLAVLVPAYLFIWRAMEWRYKGIIDLKQAMHDHAAQQHRIAVESESRLRVTMADQQKEIAELTELNRAGSPKDADRVTRLIVSVAERADTANNELEALATANSTVSDALGIPGLFRERPRGSEVMDWTSSGWRPRNPTDSTGGSG